MTLTTALSTALTGLDVARRSLQVTANNVANVNTEGFVRKKLEQSSLVLDGRGMGARSEEVERITDRFLTNELRRQRSVAARDSTLAGGLLDAQNSLFGRPGDDGGGLQNRLSELATALQNFSLQPEKTASRVDVLGAVGDLLDRIETSGELVQKLRYDTDQRIAQTVAEINSDILALDQINEEFARGIPTAELEDQRDRLLERLAEKLDITVVSLDRNTIAVYARGGTPLLEYSPRQLVYSPAAQVAADTPFDAIEVYDVSQLDPDTGEPLAGETGITLVSGGAAPTTGITGGRLKGLLELRDSRLPQLAGQFDELAELTRFVLNEAHNAATAYPPPTSLTGTNEAAAAAYDAATRTGTAYLAVIDRSTGDTVTTVAIDMSDDSATLVANLSTALAAYGTVTLTGDGPLAIDLGSYGIAISEGDSAITVTDADGRTRDYGFSHYFGLNDLVVKTGDDATSLAVNPTLEADPRLLAAASLEVDTSGPPVGTLGGAGDNRGALGLIDALERRLDTLTQGALPGRSTSMRDYAVDMVAVQAQAVNRARTAADASESLVSDLEFRRSSVSGVNLDEEMSRLVLYQQAYTASARVLTTTSELFDELMNLAR